MTIIDSHAHYEPQLLNLTGVMARMDQHNIDKTALIAAVTIDPIYKKPDYLMAIQRLMMQTPGLWMIAKKIDQSFHQKLGTWGPWYRKFVSQKANYQIAHNPDNASVFNAVNQYPERFYGWVFVNPIEDSWRKEIDKYADHPGAVGLKIHPFWHRYSITDAYGVADVARERSLPLMIHLGFDDLKALKIFIKTYSDLTMIFSHTAFPFYQRIWPTLSCYENKYVDASSHHVDAGILKRCVARLGADRVMFGTDDPYGEPNYGLTMQGWIEALEISERQVSNMLGDNFLRMVGKAS